MNMTGNNMTIKDQLEAYKEGYADGKQSVFEMISEATQHKFEDIAQLIIWIRKQESQNEVN